MLKQRLITAAILIPLIVWSLLALSTEVLRYGLVLVAGLGGWEWLQLIGIKYQAKRLAVAAAMLILGWLSFWYLPITVLLAISLLVWLMATIVIIVFAHKPLPSRLFSLFKSPILAVITATIILTGFVAGASLIHSLSAQGPALLLYVLVSVWLADTGGYFAGKRFGKTKLATAISPNKTWEGVAGALVLSTLWALLFYLYLFDTSLSFITWWLITSFTVMISIVGDLFESVFKRCFNVKDSGQLLPGHGGMLDRIDSLLAAVPVFAASLIVAGVY